MKKYGLESVIYVVDDTHRHYITIYFHFHKNCKETYIFFTKSYQIHVNTFLDERSIFSYLGVTKRNVCLFV